MLKDAKVHLVTAGSRVASRREVDELGKGRATGGVSVVRYERDEDDVRRLPSESLSWGSFRDVRFRQALATGHIGFVGRLHRPRGALTSARRAYPPSRFFCAVIFSPLY
jgi:hypothetical protein